MAVSVHVVPYRRTSLAIHIIRLVFLIHQNEFLVGSPDVDKVEIGKYSESLVMSIGLQTQHGHFSLLVGLYFLRLGTDALLFPNKSQKVGRQIHSSTTIPVGKELVTKAALGVCGLV